MKVVFTIHALQDIEAIGDWIARDNPVRAISFVLELQKSCEAIGDTPRGSTIVQRYLDNDVRRKTFRDYLIFYRIENESVEILHVLHGAKDYSDLF